MDKNPFLKRLMKEQTEDVVHSSAYAKAQNSGGLGVASTESFAERREIDSRREYVRKYGESRVINDAAMGVVKAKRYEAPKTEVGGAQSGVAGNGVEKMQTGETKAWAGRSIIKTEQSGAGVGVTGAKNNGGNRWGAERIGGVSRSAGAPGVAGAHRTSVGSASRPPMAAARNMSQPPARRNPGISR